jgi:uncharacterized membrane-anchored protein
MRRAGGDASWMRRGAKAAAGRERRRRGIGEEELGDWVDGGCAGIGEEQLVYNTRDARGRAGRALHDPWIKRGSA